MTEVDKKSIGISSLIALGLILASAIGPTFFEEPKYYCEDESSIISCPGDLSGGQQTRCYLNKEKTSWDYCKTGWILITDDLIIQEEPKNETIKEINNITEGISSGVYPIQYLCDTTKCVLKH
jgi:hypothetical protein